MLSPHADRGFDVEQLRKGKGVDTNITIGALRVDINVLRTLVGKGLEIKELESGFICEALRDLHEKLTNSGVLGLGFYTGEVMGRLEVAQVLEQFSYGCFVAYHL